MKSRHVLRYMCDHCNRGYWNKKKCANHEVLCLRNPERVCGSCKDLKVEQKPLSFYSVDVGLWYHDVDALRNLANGCPLCMLAAKMAVDSEMYSNDEDRWTDFDYRAEVKRVEDAKYPDGIPF
jgi:hypothetical protein